jgi:NAD(P)H-dependent flavin oxidoreductase YrpB (nitropropane dioxygenase family)
MIHTPVCDLLQIRHPIVLGGMAGATSVPLVAAVSNAGGLGTLGIARTAVEQVPKDIAAIRDATKAPFGSTSCSTPRASPPSTQPSRHGPLSFPPRGRGRIQDLRTLFDRAHDAGSLVAAFL